jgi:hypothetical protein
MLFNIVPPGAHPGAAAGQGPGQVGPGEIDQAQAIALVADGTSENVNSDSRYLAAFEAGELLAAYSVVLVSDHFVACKAALVSTVRVQLGSTATAPASLLLSN